MILEIENKEIESFVKEQFENAFAFSLVTKDGTVVTKYGENYYIDKSAAASEVVLGSVGRIERIGK